MTNENYHKCRTCKFCNHRGDSWVCLAESKPTTSDSSCDRYRPGCCENCAMYSKGVCSKTGEEKYSLDVCTEYDPRGSV